MRLCVRVTACTDERDAQSVLWPGNWRRERRSATVIGSSTSSRRVGFLFGRVRHYKCLTCRDTPFGRKTERWINLFGSADHLDEERYRHSDRQGVDTLVKQLEGVVLQEYERGGITTKTKNAVDFALDNVLLRFQKSPDNDTSESSGKE